MITIDELLKITKDTGASDLHLTVGIPPVYRIHGELKITKFERLKPEDTERLIMSIMNEEQKKYFKEYGEVDISFSYTSIGRFRVNVFKQRGSIAVAIRSVGVSIPNWKELGIPKSIIDLYNLKRGLVLVTGPTGSGKTTTLASIIDQINVNRKAHIITLEDPIEFLHSHKKSIVNQREIGADSRSYCNALRAALRQDPDVILVGEMRDLETISTAITAAETGHLVLSTLHTIGTINTVDRIIDVFPPSQQQQIRLQLASVLQAIISQQLIPKIDGTGRIGAFEVLIANYAIRNLIREGKTHQITSVMQTNKKIGMQTMDDNIYVLYRNGYISKNQAISFSQDSVSFSKRIM